MIHSSFAFCVWLFNSKVTPYSSFVLRAAQASFQQVRRRVPGLLYTMRSVVASCRMVQRCSMAPKWV